ncbi:MAG: response regulator transcription factor [Acidobacteriota bacterium]
MIKVLIADDHLLFRQGLRNLLELEGLKVVGEASSGPETLEQARETSPDIVLLDVAMPGRGALETMQSLKDHDGRVKILMLTGHPEDHYAIRCLKAGADGYLTKDNASDQLVAAIRRVNDGGKYISSELAEQLAMSLQNDLGVAPHETLSDREFQVMQRIASGKTVSEIGEALCLSVKTISTYRTRVLRKLNLRNNAEIMQYAIREELV